MHKKNLGNTFDDFSFDIFSYVSVTYLGNPKDPELRLCTARDCGDGGLISFRRMMNQTAFHVDRGHL